MREKYSFTYRWVTVMDDLSGNEGGWKPLSTDFDRLKSSAIPGLLKLSSKYHFPLLQSNSDAISAGEEMLRFDIEGRTFCRHAAERYQRCLPTLRDRYQNLSDEAKNCLEDVLDETGCLAFSA